MIDENAVHFFETELSYDDLIKGISGHKIEKKCYLIFVFENNNNVIGTNSKILIERFKNKPKFKLIDFNLDELSFRNSLYVVNKSFGNLNLISIK